MTWGVVSVRSPVKNIREFNPTVTHDTFVRAIIQAFREEYHVEETVCRFHESFCLANFATLCSPIVVHTSPELVPIKCGALLARLNTLCGLSVVRPTVRDVTLVPRRRLHCKWSGGDPGRCTHGPVLGACGSQAGGAYAQCDWLHVHDWGHLASGLTVSHSAWSCSTTAQFACKCRTSTLPVKKNTLFGHKISPGSPHVTQVTRRSPMARRHVDCPYCNVSIIMTLLRVLSARN